jgi:hypothetical protein
MSQFTHDTAPTQYAEGGGIRFAYRRLGIPGRSPLVFFQHFMGTLGDHDPALSDAFASDREVIPVTTRARTRPRNPEPQPPASASQEKQQSDGCL